MSDTAKFFDALERTLWTAAEGAGAFGLVQAFQALPLANIPGGWVPVVIVLLGALLAAFKSSIAQRWNGTAATLPADLQPTPSPRHALLDESGEPVEA